MAPRSVRIGSLSAVSALVGLLTLSACTIASPTYITAQEEEDDASDGKKPLEGSKAPGESSAPTGSTCDAKLVKVDLAKLTACGDGKGHCYAKDKAGIFAAKYTACPDPKQVCVPDEVLEAGGGKLKSCTSISKMPGGCFTAKLMPEILERGGSALPKDVCGADQLCIPCTDPLSNNAPSGMCEPIGVTEESCEGTGSSSSSGGTSTTPAPTQNPGCCISAGKANGVCLAESTVPEDKRSSLKQDVCPAQNKCVPKAMAENRPVKCDSNLGAGVCMDKCFDQTMAVAGMFGLMDRSTCTATELCIPCLFGKSQGMPGCT